MSHLPRRFLGLLASSLLAAAVILPGRARGQCEQWDPALSTTSTTDYPILVLAALDRGSGTELFAGGAFTTINGVAAAGIAVRSGSSWLPIGQPFAQGPVETIRSLAVFDDGGGTELYAGGFFQLPPPGPQGIARYHAGAWTALGSGFGASVDVLFVAEIGGVRSLYAGGTFTASGTTTVNHVARWNGTTWSPLGAGTDAPVAALAVFDDGTGAALYAGGSFANAGGSPANGIARWNGTAWSAVGGGVSGDVRALAVFDDPTGRALFAGGSFAQAGGLSVNHVARWDGSTWSALAGGVSHPTSAPSVETLLPFDDGSGAALFAGGVFRSAGGVAAERIARWDGASWSPLGSGMDASVHGLAAFDDGLSGGPDLLAIGNFTTAGGVSSRPIAEWRGCSSGTPFCAADGSALSCPCGNSGRHGHGCDNSAGTGGAFLHATRSLRRDSVVLTCSGELASAFSAVLQASSSAQAPPIFGDGRRCLGVTAKLLFARAASAGIASFPGPPDPSILARSTALGDPLPPGSTRYYQVVYRDPNPAFCAMPTGSTFNVSSGVVLTW